MELLAGGNYDVLILDLMMRPGRGFGVEGAEACYETGVTVLRRVRQLRYGILVIVVTAKPGVEVKRGIVCRLGLPEWCYLEKPVPHAVVLERIQRALAERRNRDAVSKGN
jgi:CheY-like chemotaxis protein